MEFKKPKRVQTLLEQAGIGFDRESYQGKGVVS